MKAKPTPQSAPVSPPPPVAPAASRAIQAPVTAPPNPLRWRFLLVLLLVGIAGGGVWYFAGRDTPPEPPFPDGITDAEVRQTFEAARAKLLESPRDGAAWGEYGTVLLANLFHKEAVVCFLEAEKRSPDDPRWPFARAQVALKRDPENALALLETAADKAKNNPKYKQAFSLTLAETLLERGETDRAAALFADHLTPPDPERAEYGLGLVAVSRGDREAATAHFLAAVHHRACRKQATSQLARLARVRGDVAAAKQYEAEAANLNQDPPWPDPYLDRLVTLLVGTRGRDRRIELLERDDRIPEALALYLAAIREQKTSKALTGAGVNLARLGRYDEAITHLREAVQVDPNDTNAQYTLALVAFTKWEKVAVADPYAAELAGGFREVMTHARTAAELKPDHYKALLFWGLALKYLGEPKAAIDPLQRGLTVAPENFDLQLGLGQVLAATGDRAGAKARFLTAKRLNGNDPRPDAELRKLGE